MAKKYVGASTKLSPVLTIYRPNQKATKYQIVGIVLSMNDNTKNP